MDNLDLGLKSQNEEDRSTKSTPEKMNGFTKIYVGNLPRGVDKDTLENFMSQFGEIERCAIIARTTKNPYAFVTFKEESSYAAALEANGTVFENETLVINKHYPTKEAEDGTREFQRTIYVGNVPRGMSQMELEKAIFDAINPIQANFRTHHTSRGRHHEGMKLIKTGEPGNNADLKICGFLVFKSLAEAEEAGNILYDLELEGEKLIVEFSKGRKMHEYRANACRIVHIGKIPHSVTEEDIRCKFRLYGELTQVRLITDRKTGLSKGYGFLDFKNPADAQHAISVLSGTKWDGKEFAVEFEKNEKRRCEGERTRRYDNRPFRRKRSFSPDRRRKRQRPLTPRRRSPSSRRETRIRGSPQNNIYNYAVEREPLRLSYNNDSAGGAETTLFVSNLPSAPEHRVRYLLEQLAGPMVVFRKEGSDGWLTYEDHRYAMAAHDILRDHKIEGIRLVVEVLDSRPNNIGRENRTWNDDFRSIQEPDRPNSYKDPYLSERKYDDHPPKRARTSGAVEGKILFVGNLIYETSKAELANIFDKYGPIESVKLPTKDGKSTRYGFIHYIYPEDAAIAQRELDGTLIRGRRIRVEISISKNKPRGDSFVKKSRYDASPRIKIEQGSNHFGGTANSRERRMNKGRDTWIRPVDRQ